MEPKRLFDIHYYQLSHYPKSDALSAKVNGEWVKTSTQSFIEQGMQVAKSLVALGIAPNDKVAIISNNRPEWNICDLGIMMSGAINVPVYPTISSKDYEFIFNDCQVKVCFVSDEVLLGKVLEVKDKITSLTKIISFSKLNDADFFDDFKQLGVNVETAEIEKRKAALTEDNLATLIYTSGTTGNPKGVMLSHKNIVSNVEGCLDRLPATEKSKALSFLPLCHIYERMVLYMFMYRGVSIYYAESMDTIGDNIREVQPNIFTAVPRLLEKVFDRIMAKGHELTGIKKSLFFWAVSLADRWEPYEGNGFFYKLQFKLADKLIFSKWREALGGQVEAVASGSAALQPRLARVFNAAGIQVLEGYGLTETSPVVSVNCYANDGFRIGTVGRALFNVKIKIADDGEILVQGPNVMLGYYNRPDATAEVMDSEGWFHTGDIGVFIEGQYLKITDRKKEIFKTSGGKYIAPQPMENRFKASPFIEQIIVIGENKKHPAALIVPDKAYVSDWCKKNGINCSSYSEMAGNIKVKERIIEEVEQINKEYGSFEQIKKIELCDRLWSVDGGELTAKLSLRRKEILKIYSELVDRIYAD